MGWFSVRILYRHGTEPDGANVYEERIVLLRAEGVEDAHERARRESDRYLQLNPKFERIGEWVAFDVHAEGNSMDLTEIWSGLSRSPLSPEEYWGQRYLRFELQPEEDGD